jgi:hypothetical protein
VPPSKRLAWAVAVAGALGLALRLWQMVVYPLPHYEAESAMAWSTHLLLQGQSPWSWSSYPAAINVYGIGYPALCAPFAWIFGTALPILRAVSVACLGASALLLYRLSRRSGHSALVCAWAALACAAAWSVNISPTARPDTLTVGLYLASLGCLEKPDPDAGDAFSAAALASLAFFVKPYGLLAWPLSAAALLARGRWSLLIQHSLSCMALLAVGALCLRSSHPLYFEEVFLNNLNIAGQDFAHRTAQWRALAPESAALITLWGLGLHGGQGWALGPWLRRPWVLAFGLSALAFHFKLSLHSGATLTYFYQLCLPLLVLAALNQPPRWRWALPLGLAALSLSLVWRLASAPYGSLPAEVAAVAELEEALAPHLRPTGNGHAAIFLWPRGSVVYDYGQGEFAAFSESDHGWPRLFPHGPALQARRLRFEAAWSRALRQQRFGIVAFGQQDGPYRLALDQAYQVGVQLMPWSPQVPYQSFVLDLYYPQTKAGNL